MLGFKPFEAAQGTLVGIELMHMLKKGQMVVEAGEESLTPAKQFYALAAYPPNQWTSRYSRRKFATYMDPPAVSRDSRTDTRKRTDAVIYPTFL
jgi:hypothetical protein